MLLNGIRAESIALTDRSFQYGDGCFTTMLTRDGAIQHWSLHVQRMNDCLDALYIPHPDWLLVEKWLSSVIRDDHKAGLKLHISRGEGGRGYSPTQVTSPNVTINDFIYPSHYEQWCQEGLTLGICATRLGHNPVLAGHKHNNRLEQVLLKGEMDRRGFADGVALDIKGNVVETTIANLFWWQNNTLFSPDLSLCGVSGVMRRVVLDWAQKQAIKVEVGQFTLSDLIQAQEVFICNSLLGVAPVRQIGSQRFDIGIITTRIQEMVES